MLVLGRPKNLWLDGVCFVIYENGALTVTLQIKRTLAAEAMA
jgi:hypothetical protein